MSIGTFVLDLLGRPTEFSYTVTRTYAVRLEFSIAGMPYTFDMTRWSGRGLRTFLPLFFEYTERNAAQFGTMEELEDGLVYHMTSDQKQNVALEAAKDVIRTVNIFFETHGRGLVDYCIWYGDKFESVDTYAKFITLVACHHVVHAGLSAPRISWTMVTFPEKE